MIARHRVQLLKNKTFIADKCFVAECFWDRLRGLIGKSGLAAGQGMLFPRCNSVHMWFMRFPIDVVFLVRVDSRDGVGGELYRVSSVRENTQPWKMLPLTDTQASETLELPAGTVRSSQVKAGDEVCIS